MRDHYGPGPLHSSLLCAVKNEKRQEDKNNDYYDCVGITSATTARCRVILSNCRGDTGPSGHVSSERLLHSSVKINADAKFAWLSAHRSAYDFVRRSYEWSLLIG